MNYDLDELFILVKELSDIYTGKESTSISYERAQQLMDAVQYCIRENDMIYDDADDYGIIPKQDKVMTAREAYDSGYGLIIDKVKRANDLYNKIIADFNDYHNRAYYDTVVKGIPEFFKWYNPRLNPMDTIILADYTVLENINGLKGIDFIYPYLKCIEKEQIFLSKLPEAYIREVLQGYHTDYEDLFINICEIVLRRVLVNMLIGIRPEKIRLEADDYKRLTDMLLNMSVEELKESLYYNLQSLITNAFFGDKGMYKYLSNVIPNLSAELRNASCNNCLGNMI